MTEVEAKYLINMMAKMSPPDLARTAKYAGCYGGADEPNMRRALLALLQHNDPHVRYCAVIGLSQSEDKTVFDALRAHRERETDADVRHTIDGILFLEQEMGEVNNQ
jgi:hypothetical protein